MSLAIVTDHASGSSPMSPANPVVYIVDDDISVREALEALLRNEGWDVEAFSSAQGFLAHSRALAPSCLILDVNLPDLNGLDLQSHLAAERTEMPIIFITGYGDVPMSVRAMKGGATEFLMKPFGDDVLLGCHQGGHRAQPRRPRSGSGGPRFARSLRLAEPSRA